MTGGGRWDSSLLLKNDKLNQTQVMFHRNPWKNYLGLSWTQKFAAGADTIWKHHPEERVTSAIKTWREALEIRLCPWWKFCSWYKIHAQWQPKKKGKIAKMVPKLFTRGQVHPRTFKRVNMVPQLCFLAQTCPCADVVLQGAMRWMWNVHFASDTESFLCCSSLLVPFLLFFVSYILKSHVLICALLLSYVLNI